MISRPSPRGPLVLRGSLAGRGGLHRRKLRHVVCQETGSPQYRRIKRTAQVTTEHEVKYEETVLIILKRVTHIHNERMVDLVKTIG